MFHRVHCGYYGNFICPRFDHEGYAYRTRFGVCNCRDYYFGVVMTSQYVLTGSDVASVFLVLGGAVFAGWSAIAIGEGHRKRALLFPLISFALFYTGMFYV